MMSLLQFRLEMSAYILFFVNTKYVLHTYTYMFYIKHDKYTSSSMKSIRWIHEYGISPKFLKDQKRIFTKILFSEFGHSFYSLYKALVIESNSILIIDYINFRLWCMILH